MSHRQQARHSSIVDYPIGSLLILMSLYHNQLSNEQKKQIESYPK
jgi:hypothetical protein